MGKPEKPKHRRHTSSSSSEQAELKAFLAKTAPVVLEVLLKVLEDANQRLTRYRQADYSRDVATLRRRYASEGLSFATKTLPNLFGEFLNYLETGKPSYTSFKCVRSAKHPVFLRQLFAMASECHDDESACIEAMQCLYQLCHAFKKFRGPYKPSTLQKQLWSFVEDDIDLRYIDFFSEPVYPILLRARKYVKELFADLDPEFDVELFIPRPGPGATNTPRRKDVRYRPHVLYKQIDDVMPYVDYYYSHPWDVVTGSMSYKALERKDAPSSRFKFVPKNYGKPRGICIEEGETQFFQQAIKQAMYHRLQSHPLTRGYVNFDDQGVNARLALQASAHGRYATLDMSAASDRVSRKLVKYLFHDCPAMRDALLAVSTGFIELPKDVAIDFISVLPCEKFAPMGSAVCFPVMALCHFVLIKAILSLSELPHGCKREVYVYGDDIILDTDCVEAVFAYLPLFGMKFNTDKSFYRSHFRESCGTHAYHGVEITPAYFKYVPESHSPRDVLLSLLSLEGQLFHSGFRATARFLRTLLYKAKAFRGYDIPCVTPKSPILGFIRGDSDAPLMRHNGLRRRYNSVLQLYEIRCISTRPSQDELVIEQDNEAYLRAFCDWGVQADGFPKSIDRAADPVLSKLGFRQPTSVIVEGRSCPYPRVDLANSDVSETLSCSQRLRDSSTEPPRFRWMWMPESAL